MPESGEEERMLVQIDDIVGDSEEDTKRLHDMAEVARKYITSFRWCLPIKTAYFADGFGGIVALFLFEFDDKIGGTDDRLWVVVGDLPSAYMVVEPRDCAREALGRYCELMDDWIGAVLNAGDFGHVFPVDAAETPGNAEALRTRLQFLRAEIIPHFNADVIGPAPDPDHRA
jgi:hypothetical protein